MFTDYLWQVLDPAVYLAPWIGFDVRALRMVITLILSSLGANFYHKYFFDHVYDVHAEQSFDRHFVLFAIGFALGFYNYGIRYKLSCHPFVTHFVSKHTRLCSILRTLATVLIVYAILHKFKGSRASVTLTFLVSTGHLVYGYWTKFGSGEELDLYIFDWTVPHCVLTLRLIAVAFDLLDGTRSITNRKEEHLLDHEFNQECIETVPSLIQLLSHSYFPASFLVGPQFSIKHTIALVEDDLEDEDDVLKHVLVPALQRIVASFYYLAILLIGSHYFPAEYLLSHDFQSSPLVWRLVYFTISIRIQFYRYFFFFLFSEGNCILYGANFDGNQNRINYKLCRNVDPKAFDFTGISFLTSFNQGYNLCTNRWIAKYVFYRLPYIQFTTTYKPLLVIQNWINHRYTRFFVSSMFICLWHGFHLGYFFTFTYIPINFIVEWDFLDFYWPMIRKAFGIESFQNIKVIIRIPLFILLRLYCMFSLSYAYVSMLFLSYDTFIAVFKSIFFIQHLAFLLYVLLRIIVKILFLVSERYMI